MHERAADNLRSRLRQVEKGAEGAAAAAAGQLAAVAAQRKAEYDAHAKRSEKVSGTLATLNDKLDRQRLGADDWAAATATFELLRTLLSHDLRQRSSFEATEHAALEGARAERQRQHAAQLAEMEAVVETTARLRTGFMAEVKGMADELYRRKLQELNGEVLQLRRLLADAESLVLAKEEAATAQAGA